MDAKYFFLTLLAVVFQNASALCVRKTAVPIVITTTVPTTITTTPISTNYSCQSTIVTPSMIASSILLSNGLVASAGYITYDITLMNYTTGQKISALTGHTSTIYSLSQTKSGLVLSASGDDTLIVWNITAGTNTILRTLSQLTSVTELSDGVLAAGSSSGYLYFWQSDKTLITNFKAHAGQVSSFVSIENGSFITGSQDQTIMLWNLTNLKSLNTQNVGYQIKSMLILANGWLAVSTDSNTIQLWNITSSGFVFVKELSQSKTGGISLNGMVQLPNGLLFGASNDNSIKIWSVDTGSLLNSLQGHSGGVQSLSLTSNGWLISGSYDTNIKVWGE